MERFHASPDDLARIVLDGRLDAKNAAEVRARLAAAIDAGARHLLLDMDAVPFMSSAGIRVLQETHQRLARIKGTLRIETASDFVREMLEIVGLYDLLGAPPARAPEPVSETFELAESALVGTLIHLDPEARLGMETAGADGLIQPFPATSFSIGRGALAGEAERPEDTSCCTLIAAGGYAAYVGADAREVPDFMIHAPEFIPRLFLCEGQRWSGDFACFIDVTCVAPDGLALAALGPVGCQILGADRLGLVLVGETLEVFGERLATASAPVAPHHHGTSALLAAGWIERSGAGCLHGAIFAHAPLRKGEQRLVDAVTAVFEQPLIDVLRLAPATRLRRGALWLAPIAPAAQPPSR